MLTRPGQLFDPFHDAPPIGQAPNVAPNEFPHPVYRYGIALSLPIPAEVTP